MGGGLLFPLSASRDISEGFTARGFLGYSFFNFFICLVIIINIANVWTVSEINESYSTSIFEQRILSSITLVFFEYILVLERMNKCCTKIYAAGLLRMYSGFNNFWFLFKLINYDKILIND